MRLVIIYSRNKREYSQVFKTIKIVKVAETLKESDFSERIACNQEMIAS